MANKFSITSQFLLRYIEHCISIVCAMSTAAPRNSCDCIIIDIRVSLNACAHFCICGRQVQNSWDLFIWFIYITMMFVWLTQFQLQIHHVCTLWVLTITIYSCGHVIIDTWNAGENEIMLDCAGYYPTAHMNVSAVVCM